jgi:Transglycosylase SLT domain/Peptidase family M23
MKRTLLLISALAVLAVGVASGVAFAQLGGIGGGGVNLPEVELNVTACSNGADDDGDGLVDSGDPGCSSPIDSDEYNPPAPEPPPPTTTTPDAGGGGTTGGGGGGFEGGGDTREPGGGADTTGGGGGVGNLVDPETGSPTGRDITTDGGVQRGAGDGKTGGAKPMKPKPERKPDGTPTLANPTTTIAPFGPAPVGVPNIVIDQFEIPPFLLPLYQACGTQYAIPWQVLASINKIETAFGTNLNVSTAGAVGWMQFLPSTWEAYGVDANADGRKDPYNPVDAICAAARYLRAAGGEPDLRAAIFAYNHADWYVDEVLLYANAYADLPANLIGGLTGLAEYGHFPVAANSRYADDISEREAILRATPSARAELGNAADVIASSPTRRGINIYSREGAPVVAVHDGVIKKIGQSPRLGNYIVLQDAYGNRFIYAELGRILNVHPVPKSQKLTAEDFKLVSPHDDDAPTGPASAGGPAPDGSGAPAGGVKASGPVNTEDARRRLYANPERPNNRDRASLSGQLDDLLSAKMPGFETFKRYFSSVFGFDREETELRPLGKGSKVVGGTVIARMDGSSGGVAPHINFAIRPTGRGAPKIDPKPILDGWKLLEATAIYRAAGKDPFASNASVGQVLLMSKELLAQRVLADPRLEIYECGRTDIASGQVDRRVLATLEFLVEKGFRLTITSLKCGHGFYTASGNISNHSSGNAVDIAAINGIPVLGNQGPGTLTHALLQTVMQLQGTMVPEELISLEELGGPSFALSDHADHVHIGWQPLYGTGKLGEQFAQLLKPDQWERLIDRIGEIDNPEVPVKASKYAISTGKVDGKERSSSAHVGD